MTNEEDRPARAERAVSRVGVGDDKRFFARSATAIGLAAAVVLAILLFVATIQIVLVAFAGLLLAVLLESLADFVAQKTRIGPRPALALVVLALAGGFAAFATLLAPQIAEQVGTLAETLPQSIESVRERLTEFAPVRELLEHGPAWPEGSALLSRAGRVFSTTFGAIANVVVVLVLGIYLAAQPRLYVEGAIRLFAVPVRARAREVLAALGTTLRWWLLGRLAGMTVIGALTTAGLYALGSPLALAIGLLTGLLSFIPYIGPLLSAAPPVLIALAEGPRQALYVVGLYLVVQAIESYVVTPFVDRKTVLLPPALTLFMQLLLGMLLGVLGVLLAGPITAVLFVLVRMLYVEDALGDRSNPVLRR